MKNEYRMEPGQTKVLESEVVQATGHAPLYFVVRLKAECLSDGSVAHDVEADLCSGGLRLVTWTWHPYNDRMARSTFDQVHKELDTTRRPTRPEFGIGPDDVDEAVPDSDSVVYALGLAWGKGYLKGGLVMKKAEEAKTDRMLQDISDRSADIAERHREERHQANLEGYADGRYDGLRIMVEGLGYRIRLREDRFQADRFEWTLETPEPRLSIKNVGGFVSSEEAAEAAIAQVPGLIKDRIWSGKSLMREHLEAAKKDRDANAKGYARMLETVEDLRKRLQVQTRLASEAMDSRDRLEGAKDRLEGELMEAKDDIVALKDAVAKQGMKRATIRVTKQVNLKDVVDLVGDRTYIAYVGKDPGGRDLAVVPMCNQSVVLRAVIGDVWTVSL